MQFQFNAAQFDPSMGMAAWPHGWHDCVITNMDAKPTQKGGGYMAVMIKGIGGTVNDLPMMIPLNLWNQNPQAVDIANREMAALVYVTLGVNQGRLTINQDTSEMYNIPFKVLVGPQRDNPARTEAVAYKDRYGNDPKPANGGGPQQGQGGQPAFQQGGGQPAFAPQGQPQFQQPQQPAPAFQPGGFQPQGPGGPAFQQPQGGGQPQQQWAPPGGGGQPAFQPPPQGAPAFQPPQGGAPQWGPPGGGAPQQQAPQGFAPGQPQGGFQPPPQQVQQPGGWGQPQR